MLFIKIPIKIVTTKHKTPFGFLYAAVEHKTKNNIYINGFLINRELN